ncbi:PEP-CTERM sorting domain-containing protein [Neorhodopirellula lusitana]|uniref:PEP-CTERM sorting domain-containing protein n=1 Tax=Neorhodopirellula lusitana TaxID=445327 RepID=UPI00384F8CAD
MSNDPIEDLFLQKAYREIAIEVAAVINQQTKTATLSLAMIVTMGTVCSIGQCHAATVSVINAGFEDISGESPVNEFTFGPLNGWDLYDPGLVTNGGAGGSYYIGTLRPDAPTNFTAGASEGLRVGIAFNFSGSGGQGEYGLQQTLTETLQPNTSYALQVDIGNIASGQAQSGTFFNLDGLPGYRVDLLAGGEILAQDDNSLFGTIDEGLFGTSQINFTTGTAHAQLGENLQIRLVNLNEVDPAFPDAHLEVDFDNVRLSASAVPEPSCIIAFGCVAGGWTLCRKRRFKGKPQ